MNKTLSRNLILTLLALGTASFGLLHAQAHGWRY